MSETTDARIMRIVRMYRRGILSLCEAHDGVKYELECAHRDSSPEAIARIMRQV